MWAHIQIPVSNANESGRVHGVPGVHLGHSLLILRLCFLISFTAVLTVQSAHTILLRVTHCHLGGNVGVGALRPASLPGVTSYSPSSPRRPQKPGHNGCALCRAAEQNFRAFRFCLFLKNNKKPKKRQQLSVPRLRPSELGWAWPGGGAVKKPQINRAVSWPSQASSCGKPVVGALV